MSRCVTARSQPGRRPPTRTPRLEQPLTQAGLVGDRDEVRLHGRGIDPEALGEPPRARVVVGEPLDVVVERVELAAATIPACRIAPPKRNFCRQARSISSAEPARSAPSGQPSPFERQSVTVSASADSRRRLDPGGDRRVEQPRAVEVDGEPELARGVDRRRGARRAARRRPPELRCACSRARRTLARGSKLVDARGCDLLGREPPGLAPGEPLP